MSFNEKSAWAMGLLTGSVTLYMLVTHGRSIITGYEEGFSVDFRFISLAIGFVVLSIVIHAILGAVFSKEAAEGQDERDRMIMYRAGAMAGSFLGFAVMWGLWVFATTGAGHIMFLVCFLGLLLSTTLNYAAQVFMYRKGV